MKILVIGDFHGVFPKRLKKEAKKADIILCTGDLGGSDDLLEIIFKNLIKGKWWKVVGKKASKNFIEEDHRSGRKIIEELNSLKKETYMVNGNWDFTSTSRAERTAGLNLKKYSEIIREKRFLILHNFFGGMVTAGGYLERGMMPDKKRKRLLKQNKKETKQLMKHLKKPIDILFAHYPPYGIFDVVKFNGENPMNGKHVGFKGYTEFIKKNKPKLFICGHMHEYQGKKKIGNTLVVATGSAKEGKAVLIDFDIKNKKVKKVKFLK
jgi:Icc-related predicted phosphoesterase